MDLELLVVVFIVATAAGWCCARAWRWARRLPTCDGSCCGCPAARTARGERGDPLRCSPPR